MNFKNCVYISWKIQILTILRHKITQIFTKKYYLLSKFSKLHNLETHFCELLRPRAPPFQKIKRNPLNQVTFMQKSCFLGPTTFEIPQPNWYYCVSLHWNHLNPKHFASIPDKIWGDCPWTLHHWLRRPCQTTPSQCHWITIVAPNMDAAHK